MSTGRIRQDEARPIIGYSGAQLDIPVELVQRAEELGYDSVWTAEAYGSDAVTPLAFLAGQDQPHQARHRHHAARRAHARPMPPCRRRRSMRWPAAAASSPASASRARRSSRAGTASPGASPTTASRTTSAIMRKIFAPRGAGHARGPARSACPTRARVRMGVGKPLKSILHMNPDIPIYLGTGNEATVKLTAEIADGWLPLGFVPGAMAEYRPWLEEGFRRAGDGKELRRISPSRARCTSRSTDDVKARARQAEAGGGALRRRHGPSRQELPQGHHGPARLRRGRRAHPGALPGRPQGRGDGRRARRVGRHEVAGRPARAHQASATAPGRTAAPMRSPSARASPRRSR